MAWKREIVYKGCPYQSVSALAKAVGIKRSTLSMALNKDSSATVESVVDSILKKKVTIEGVEYSSLACAMRAYNISSAIVSYRMNNGMSLEEAVTTPVQEISKKIEYNGCEYDSVSQLLREKGVSLNTYNNRRRLGWSLEKIIETPVGAVGRGNAHECFFLGKRYPSKRQVGVIWGEKLGVPLETYLSRLSSGDSIAQALGISVDESIAYLPPEEYYSTE